MVLRWIRCFLLHYVVVFWWLHGCVSLCVLLWLYYNGVLGRCEGVIRVGDNGLVIGLGCDLIGWTRSGDGIAEGAEDAEGDGITEKTRKARKTLLRGFRVCCVGLENAVLGLCAGVGRRNLEECATGRGCLCGAN